MSEQVVLNLRQAVKDEIKKADLDDKEYGFEIARDLYSNMTLLDLHNFFANNNNIIQRVSCGKISFEEAEEAVLKWREEKGDESNWRQDIDVY